MDPEKPLAHVRAGRGPAVMLVHGGTLCGALCWAGQAPLQARWETIVVDREGYAEGEAPTGEDHEADAQALARWLEAEPLHLVGQSSGGVVALRAAGLRPDRVQSLTLCEPPFWPVAMDVPDVAAARAALDDVVRREDLSDAEWIAAFAAAVGGAAPPGPPEGRLAQGVRNVRAVKVLPWEVAPDLDAVAAADFPKLVISGDHSPAFEAVADRLTQRLRAERGFVRGMKHAAPRMGGPFNALLEDFLSRAEAARG